MRVYFPVLAPLVLAGSLAVAGQTPQTPPMPTPGPPTPGQRTPPRGAPLRPGEQPQTGSAVLRGQVLSVDGTPLRRALVRAMSQDGRGSGTASTDQRGTFEVRELPAGRYTVTASKAGFVSMAFGQRRAEQSGTGTVLDVQDKQIVDKILIALPRGAVITGKVMDEFGDPIAGAQVSAMRMRFMGGGARRMMSSGGDTTDDQGTYRIYGLAPGEYVLQGVLRSSGMFMGPGTGSTEAEGYAPSYFPGTPNMGEAQRVTVRGGQELTGINFSLAAARLARIRGRVTSATGEPAANMMIMVTSADPSAMGGMMTMGAQTRGDGTFQVGGVPPGSYNLIARSTMNPNSAEAGQVRVMVANEDIDNVAIAISRGAIARGVIRTDDGSPLPIRPSLVRIFAGPADPNPQFVMPGGGPTVNDDGTFELTGLFDRRLIRASLSDPSSEWFFKGTYWRDQDVTDTPMEFVPGQVVEDLDVVFTRRTTEISGRVLDDKNQPVRDATIVIFAGDSSRWTYASRYVRPARVDQDGRFEIKNMPPLDDYRLVAVRDLEDGRFSDPEFLEAVRESGARVSLLEGGKAVQDLKVMRAP